jgi:hypothetical protein
VLARGRPEDESTGPRKDFERIFGVAATRANADACEALLREWAAHWHEVSAEAA